MPPQRGLLSNLYRSSHGGDADFETLQRLLGRAAQVEEKRNRITHSVWGAGSEGTITRIKTTAKERHGLRFDLEHVSEDDLRAVATEIQHLAWDVQEFWLGAVRLAGNC